MAARSIAAWRDLTPEAEFAARTHPGDMEAVFIRAPVIRRVGPQARVLARYQGDPVLVEQGRHMVATFHPELTADPAFTSYSYQNCDAANSKTRVLFICIGNSCRSQMAEGFARRYGSDVMIAASAGLAPAYMVARDTIRAMDEKNIDIRDQFPKSLKQLGRANFDLFVNMSGYDLPPEIETPVREWDVPDPVARGFRDPLQDPRRD